jgi:hypothetical protein
LKVADRREQIVIGLNMALTVCLNEADLLSRLDCVIAGFERLHTRAQICRYSVRRSTSLASSAPMRRAVANSADESAFLLHAA